MMSIKNDPHLISLFIAIEEDRLCDTCSEVLFGIEDCGAFSIGFSDITGAT
jgi:hypothetical protein